MRVLDKKSMQYYNEKIKGLLGLKTSWYLSDQEVFKELQLGVHYITGSRVPGDIAEFGSHGRSAKQICKAMKDLYSEKHIHLFDSFEGFPTTQEDANSPHVLCGIWPKGGSKPPLVPNELAKMLSKQISKKQIHVYPGWFNATIQTIEEGTTFSMVHIDCDLYKSTFDVLDYLFAHRMISKGCIIYFDDWYCNKGSPEYGEQKAWAVISKKYNVKFSPSKWYGWAGSKLIVHEYEHI